MTPAANASFWAVRNALTHHKGRAAIAREFEAIAAHECTAAPVTLSRVNARESDAGERFESDAK